MMRLTPVVRNLIIINVIVFILVNLSPGLLNYFALWNVRLPLFKPYQLFTYMFTQEGFFHIFFNMLALASLGPILESTWGPMRFLTFYLVCGIGAGIFNILIDLFFGMGTFGSMIGASGAVFGILTAFGILFPNMEMMMMFIPFPIKAKYIVLGFGAYAVYSALHPTPGDNTANFAHVGGIVVALVFLQFWKGYR